MMLIGDKIEQLLRAIGITDSRIKALTGKDCKCAKRKAALNRRHTDLKVWLRMRRSAFDAKRRAARRNMNTAKTRFVMAWKCLRYGNPYYVGAVASAKATSASKTLPAKAPETLGNLVSN